MNKPEYTAAGYLSDDEFVHTIAAADPGIGEAEGEVRRCGTTQPEPEGGAGPCGAGAQA